VPLLLTGLAVYIVFILAAGGKHFRNSPGVWTKRFYAMLRAISFTQNIKKAGTIQYGLYGHSG
jgi:hypothetical protein